MVTKWFNEIINPQEECQGGQHAFFIQAQPQLKIEADNIGSIGNDITLVNNTANPVTISDLLTEWNASNPNNTATQTAGLPDYLLEPSESISLTGGIDPICFTADYNFYNTKEDQEVLQGLFNGRLAHEQKHDIHTIKAVKFWDNL